MEGVNDIACTVHWVPRLYKDRNRYQGNSNAKRNENVELIKYNTKRDWKGGEYGVDTTR